VEFLRQTATADVQGSNATQAQPEPFDVSDIIGQQPVKAHVTKSQFGLAAAKLLLPVGSERDRRMATADGVLPGVQKLSPLLGKIAPEIYRCHGLSTPVRTNKGRAV
jgi:hypothetical protein